MPFDTTLARLTVQLSAAAYHDRLRAQDAVAALGLTDFRWFSAASTQAFSAAGTEHLHVAFRGSEANPIDWSRNARFRPIAGEFGRIHSGFDGGVEEVWREVLPVIEQTGKPVVFTGHSLAAPWPYSPRSAPTGRAIWSPPYTPTASRGWGIAISAACSGTASETGHSGRSTTSISSPGCRSSSRATGTPGSGSTSTGPAPPMSGRAAGGSPSMTSPTG